MRKGGCWTSKSREQEAENCVLVLVSWVFGVSVRRRAVLTETELPSLARSARSTVPKIETLALSGRTAARCVTFGPGSEKVLMFSNPCPMPVAVAIEEIALQQ